MLFGLSFVAKCPVARTEPIGRTSRSAWIPRYSATTSPVVANQLRQLIRDAASLMTHEPSQLNVEHGLSAGAIRIKQFGNRVQCRRFGWSRRNGGGHLLPVKSPRESHCSCRSCLAKSSCRNLMGGRHSMNAIAAGVLDRMGCYVNRTSQDRAPPASGFRLLRGPAQPV